jgi:hypothetical protein
MIATFERVTACAHSDCDWTGGNDPFVMNEVTEEDIDLADSGYGRVNPVNIMVRSTATIVFLFCVAQLPSSNQRYPTIRSEESA